MELPALDIKVEVGGTGKMIPPPENNDHSDSNAEDTKPSM
jgi:hypothetical protein